MIILNLTIVSVEEIFAWIIGRSFS